MMLNSNGGFIAKTGSTIQLITNGDLEKKSFKKSYRNYTKRVPQPSLLPFGERPEMFNGFFNTR